MQSVRPIDSGSNAERAEWIRMRAALHGGDDHDAECRAILQGALAPYGVLVVPRVEGGLAGYIEVGERPYAEGCASSPVAYVESWWVDPDRRGAGVGRALMRAAEDWALQRGHREVASDTLITNEQSIAVHGALGFEEVERIVCFRKSI